MVASITTSFDYRLFEFISTFVSRTPTYLISLSPHSHSNFKGTFVRRGAHSRIETAADSPTDRDRRIFRCPWTDEGEESRKRLHSSIFSAGRGRKTLDHRPTDRPYHLGCGQREGEQPISVVLPPQSTHRAAASSDSHLTSPLSRGLLFRKALLLGPRSTCEVQGNPAIPTPPPCPFEGPFTQPPSRFGGPSCRYL